MKCKSKYPLRIKERREVKSNYRSYFLDEFEIFDGESFVKFNLIDINHEKNEITVRHSFYFLNRILSQKYIDFLLLIGYNTITR